MGGAIITRAKFEREWNERDDRLREPTKKKKLVESIEMYLLLDKTMKGKNLG